MVVTGRGGSHWGDKNFYLLQPPPIPPLFLFSDGFFQHLLFFAHQLFWQITRSLQGLVQQITLIRPGNALQKNAAAAVAAAVVRWRGVLLLCFRFGVVVVVTTQPCHLNTVKRKGSFNFFLNIKYSSPPHTFFTLSPYLFFVLGVVVVVVVVVVGVTTVGNIGIHPLTLERPGLKKNGLLLT